MHDRIKQTAVDTADHMAALAQHMIHVLGDDYLSINEIFDGVTTRLFKLNVIVVQCDKASVELCLHRFCRESDRYGGQFDLFALDGRGFWNSKVTTVEWSVERHLSSTAGL